MSEKTAQAARSVGIKVEHVWRPGVPTPTIATRPEFENGEPSQIPTAVIGFSGNMALVSQHRKGLDLLESIVTKVSRLAAIKLQLCGEGGTPLFEKLKSSGVSASLVTPENRKEVLDFFKTIDIYLCTSRLEGGPLPVIEAMAAGCAVISTPVGFVPEIIISGNNGILCEIDSSDDFESALMDLVQNPRKRIEMGKRASEDIKHNWSWGHDRDRIIAARDAVAQDPPISIGLPILRAFLSCLARKILAKR
ncbi:MAG: glycosyltransferase family 4 protein [Nitrospinaceae bacterium]|nr:glycosyltransferase family 4 protein [Nitrospinaceae bacterium]